MCRELVINLSGHRWETSLVMGRGQRMLIVEGDSWLVWLRYGADACRANKLSLLIWLDV